MTISSTSTVFPLYSQPTGMRSKTHSIPEGNGVGGNAVVGNAVPEGNAVGGNAVEPSTLCDCPTCAAHRTPAKLLGTLFVALRPPSQNEAVDRHGPGRFAYQKQRAAWVHAIRWQMQQQGIAPATGKRRLVLTRVFSGREKLRDYGNFVGGCKLVLDAMRPTKTAPIKQGRRKGVLNTTEGAALIVDDAPQWLEDVYLQERSTTKESGLRIAVYELEVAP